MIPKMSIRTNISSSSKSVVKMLFFLILSVFSTLEVSAKGEFSILHHPKSIIFKGHDNLGTGTVKEVFSSSLGFSNSQFSNWKGIFITDPFYLAECVANVYVVGVPSLGQAKAHHFPLKFDEDDDLFQSVKDSIEMRYPEDKSQIVNVNLNNGLEDIVPHEIFKGIKNDKPKQGNYLYLKNSHAEDREFLKEVHLLNKIADNISNNLKSDGIPDVFWFKVSSLLPLKTLYGENSTQVKEAEHLLNEALLNLNAAFKKAYNGAVIFSIITNDGSHSRKTRAAVDAGERDLNLATDYDENYPVIFNIVLWLCVVLGFSLLAISLAIGGMDPGRDSIIYRMTNPRMKKDN